MKVELLDYTQDALNLLLRTKNTRLGFGEDPANWEGDVKKAHLDYMRDTIQSSWEFVSYTFLISEVTRAFTHQLVRTRTGSYAQESQRTVDVRKNGHLVPTHLTTHQSQMMSNAMDNAVDYYKTLVDGGVPVQDARGVLPTNTFTSIVAKFTLRGLHDMALTRLCVRTQGEYQNVFREMKAAVVGVHPWAEPFIRVACAQNGICIFPRYKECPIQHLTYNGGTPDSHKMLLEQIQRAYSITRHEATPVASGGRTMP